MSSPWSSLTLSIWGAYLNPLRVRLRTPDELGHHRVSVRCPRLGCICRIRGFAAELTLELLISNPIDSRAPVAPTLTEWDLRPLVSNRTLRGFGFSSPWLGPCGGYTYSVRNWVIKWPQSWQ
jgi:hypothetical protein